MKKMLESYAEKSSRCYDHVIKTNINIM